MAGIPTVRNHPQNETAQFEHAFTEIIDEAMVSRINSGIMVWMQGRDCQFHT
jgi:hypothetical protein